MEYQMVKHLALHKGPQFGYIFLNLFQLYLVKFSNGILGKHISE